MNRIIRVSPSKRLLTIAEICSTLSSKFPTLSPQALFIFQRLDGTIRVSTDSDSSIEKALLQCPNCQGSFDKKLMVGPICRGCYEKEKPAAEKLINGRITAKKLNEIKALPDAERRRFFELLKAELEGD